MKTFIWIGAAIFGLWIYESSRNRVSANISVSCSQSAQIGPHTIPIVTPPTACHSSCQVQKTPLDPVGMFGNGSSVPFTTTPQKDFNGQMQTIPDTLITDQGVPESFSPGTPDSVKLSILHGQGQTYKGQ